MARMRPCLLLIPAIFRRKLSFIIKFLTRDCYMYFKKKLMDNPGDASILK